MQVDPLKRVAAMFMALIFLLGCIPAYATQESDANGRVIVEDASATAGGQVTVNLKLEDVPHLAAFQFFIQYDENVLSLTDRVAKDLSGVQFGKITNGNSFKLSWMEASQDNVDVNMAIAQLTFEVNSNASLPTLIKVSYDAEQQAIFYNTEDGPVAVNPKPIDGTITIQSLTGKVTVENGTLVDPPADNLYAPGETVRAKANDVTGQVFKGWTSADIAIPEADAKNPELSFTMPTPAKPVTVKAEFETDATPQKVTVENGTLVDPPADNLYAPGETVKIKANNPPSGKNFSRWTWTGPDSLNFLTGSAQNSEASFQMPNSEVNLTATYSSTDTPCYVATAVYGSYDCPEVWTLRRFRDEVLAQTWYGRLFIRLYYAVSPTAVKLFGGCEWFQNFFRERLDKMVSNLQADGFESTPYQDRAW